MNKIIRWYNQNRHMFWIVVTAVAGFILILQTLNNYYKNNTKEESSSTNISTTTYNNPNYSVVSQKEINKNTSKESINVIKTFFNYCNTGEINEAYNLLSIDCKQELYPTVDDFREDYYSRIFTETKMYNSTLWISSSTRNTYRLEIMGDILATGKTEDMPIEDYYTVINENGEYRLSVSNYIGKEEINISKAQNNVTITILNKKMYMDYEKYEVKVENNTQGNLILNTKQNTDSMYIQDKNDLKYIAFLNEISEYDLNILRGANKTYNIKFNRVYKPDIRIKKIVFDNISVENQNLKVEIEL